MTEVQKPANFMSSCRYHALSKAAVHELKIRLPGCPGCALKGVPVKRLKEQSDSKFDLRRKNGSDRATL